MKFVINRHSIGSSEPKVDEYVIHTDAFHLSPVLETLINEENDEICVLPVHFEDQYMKLIERYFEFFSKNPLPKTIPKPLPAKCDASSILNDTIYSWIESLTLSQLSRLRQVCMFFDLEIFMNQLDAILALSFRTDIQCVLKEFHEPNVVLSSTESVTNQFSFLN